MPWKFAIYWPQCCPRATKKIFQRVQSKKFFPIFVIAHGALSDRASRKVKRESGVNPEQCLLLWVPFRGLRKFVCRSLCHWWKLGRRDKRNKSEDLPVQYVDFMLAGLRARIKTMFFSRSFSTLSLSVVGALAFRIGRLWTKCRRRRRTVVLSRK